MVTPANTLNAKPSANGHADHSEFVSDEGLLCGSLIVVLKNWPDVWSESLAIIGRYRRYLEFRHRVIFDSIEKLLNAGIEINAYTVAEDVVSAGHFGDVHPDYIHTISHERTVGIGMNWKEFAQKVRTKLIVNLLDIAGKSIVKLANRTKPFGTGDEVVAEALRIIADIELEPPTLSRAKFIWAPVDCKTFASADYRPKWLVKNFLVEGQPGICGGPQKSLKTSICAIELGLSLATATDFLGKFIVPQKKRVVVVSGESGRHALQDTAIRVCRSKGIYLEEVDRIKMQFAIPQLAVNEQLATLIEGLKNNGTEVGIFDPLYLMLLAGAKDTSASNLYDIGPLLLRIADACLSIGCTPILLHHATKPSATKLEPLTLSDLAFAGVAEFARQWCLISRRESFEEGSGIHKLWMVCGGSVGHNGCWGVDVDEGQLEEDFSGRKWDVTVIPASEIRSSQKSSKQAARDEAARIQNQSDETALLDALDALTNDDRPIVPRKEVESRCGLSRRRMEGAEARLMGDKIIDRAEVTIKSFGNGTKPGVGLRRVKSSD